MPKLLPSETKLAETRHHKIVWLRPPHKWTLIALGVSVVIFLFAKGFAVLVFLAIVVPSAWIRGASWNAERVILTNKRIIRVRGIPETTSAEASLRIDRVSGMRLVETVPGKILGYGHIELEAPGDHPDVRRLLMIPNPMPFYLTLRRLVFDDDHPDPDDVPGEYVTAPLPDLRERRDAPRGFRSPKGPR